MSNYKSNPYILKFLSNRTLILYLTNSYKYLVNP